MAAYLLLSSRVLLATVFLVAAVGKGSRRTRFSRFVDLVQRLTEFPRGLARLLALGLTLCEALVSVLLLLPVDPRPGLVGAAGLLLAFVGVILRAVRSGVFVRCNCFGGLGAVMSYPLVVRNLLLVAVAAVGLAAASGAGRVEVLPAAATVLAGAGLALAVIVYYDAVAEAVLLRVARRHGGVEVVPR